jgi:Ca2+/H+ antiporter, TMEM165/GDT1 family
MEWITAALTAFILVVPVELPDKTFVATLVLATKYRPLPVWLGVAAAFAVQCVVAVAAGRLLLLLPERPVRLIAAALFVIGAAVLFRGARRADTEEAEQEQEYERKIRDRKTGWRAVLASFLILFAAEWGDLSQLMSASLVAAGRSPSAVFVGSWVALVAVAGLGVVAGRALVRRVRLSLVRRIGGVVCAALALVTLASVVV